MSSSQQLVKSPLIYQATLVRNGPALFEIGVESFNHWFDGQAMNHTFSIRGGKVVYSNQFLDTKNFRAHKDKGRIGATHGPLQDNCLGGCSPFFRRVKNTKTRMFQ